MGMRELTSNFESTPEVLVCGRDWKPEVGVYEREYGGDDA